MFDPDRLNINNWHCSLISCDDAIPVLSCVNYETNLCLQSWTVFLGCSTEDAATGVLEKRIRGPIGVPGAYPDPGDLLHLQCSSYCHTTAKKFVVFVVKSLLRSQRVLIEN